MEKWLRMSVVFLLLMSTVFSKDGISQLAVTNNFNATTLATTLAGPNITVSNASITGDTEQAGTFTYSGGALNMTSGIVLSTGIATDAVGPNNNSGGSTSFNGPGDAELSNLSGQNTKDAVSLQFDFLLTSTAFEFSFIFASEEYNFYVGGNYNDAFAFFLSGPGISGEENIAFVPGTSSPITINNINNGSYSQYYNDNEYAAITNDTEFNGFTTLLKAERSGLEPCSVYTLRLVIADGYDASYDSGVFLQENSFVQENNIDLTLNGAIDINQCGDFSILLDANDNDYDTYLWQDGSTGETYTATDYGVLYSVEATKCGTTFRGEITFIEDCDDFETTSPTNCLGDLRTLTVDSPLGVEFEYSIDEGVMWSSSNEFTDLSSGTYRVIVRDLNTGYESNYQEVILDVYPVLDVSSAFVLHVACFGDTTGSTTLDITGGLSPYGISWNPSNGTSTGNAPVVIDKLPEGEYTIVATDDNGCTDEIIITINQSPELIINGLTEDLVCGEHLASIQTSVIGGNPDYTYSWSSSTEELGYLEGTTSGSHTLTITDALGCEKDTVFIIDSVALQVDVNPLETEIIEKDSVQLFATDGYYYNWSPVLDLSCTDCPDPYASPIVTTTYEVLVTDDYGCSTLLSTYIEVAPLCGEIYIPDIFSPNNDNTNDYLCVYGRCIKYMTFRIFNRWGEEVFATSDTMNCWGGTYQGKPSENGSYMYQFQALLNDGGEIHWTGNINLIR